MFKIKICGVTRAEDMTAIHDAGADAVGINLVVASPRCVSLLAARELTKLATGYGLSVFVVVMNPSRDELARIVKRVEPDGIQLHGRELPSELSTEINLPIVKALSWTGLAQERLLAEAWSNARTERTSLAFLVDAYAPGAGGGTGKVARWDLLMPRPASLMNVPMLLAGGLTAANVCKAIESTQCQGVDTASGVESSPGIKDAYQVAAFVAAARQALNNRNLT